MAKPMETMTVRIVTPSMTPTILVGEVVTIERRVPDVGDIGAFLIGDVLVIHRVVDRWNTAAGEFFVHRGDAGRVHGLCKTHEVVGAVAGFERREPIGKDALVLWMKGRFVSVGAALSRASELRPLFLALVRDESNAADVPVVTGQAPVNLGDDDEPEYEDVELDGLTETPLPADLLAMPDDQWAKYRLQLLQNAGAELEAAEANRTEASKNDGRRAGALVFPLGGDEWEDESKSKGYTSMVDPCKPGDKP